MPSIREYTKNKKENKEKKDSSDSSFMKKLFIHKVTVFYRIIIGIVVIVGLVIGTYIYFQNKVYTKYNVIETIERKDTATTKYYPYADGILKCSNDGVAYTDYSDKVLWNQTFEMVNPILDICNEYVAIADKDGNKVFIFNKKGLQSEIATDQPIEKLQVASQGVVFTLLDDGNNSLIKVYDTEGESLVGGKQPMAKSGYPLDMAVSDNGERLVVSYLYVDSGIMKTNIAFYNFGSVGQNKGDNLVSGYPYESSVFPSVKYVNETTAVAFGDKKIGIYQGRQIPELIKEIEVEDEIQSVHDSSDSIGVVFENEDPGQKYRLELYDLTGKKTLSLKFDQDYNDIVIKDKEILIIGEMGFRIYRMSGVQKFAYDTKRVIFDVIKEKNSNKYVIVGSGSTDIINLKLN